MQKLRTILLAALVGAALVTTGGTAAAQTDPAAPPADSNTQPEAPAAPEVPDSQEQPPAEQPNDGPAPDEPILAPEISVLSVCSDSAGSIEVSVHNPGKRGTAYVVDVLPADGAELPPQSLTVSLDAGATEVVRFGAPAGQFRVRAHILDLEDVEVVSVDRCGEIGPVDDPLQIFVRCQDGAGLVTIRVFNAEGDSRTFTVSTKDLELPDDVEKTFELDNHEYTVVVDELPAADGTFTVRVVSDGVDHSETGTVACAAVPTTTTPTTTTPTTTTPTTTTTGAPVPQASAGTAELASTGASVGGVGLLGLVALALGGTLLLTVRRRRTSPGKP